VEWRHGADSALVRFARVPWSVCFSDGGVQTGYTKCPEHKEEMLIVERFSRNAERAMRGLDRGGSDKHTRTTIVLGIALLVRK